MEFENETITLCLSSTVTIIFVLFSHSSVTEAAHPCWLWWQWLPVADLHQANAGQTDPVLGGDWKAQPLCKSSLFLHKNHIIGDWCEWCVFFKMQGFGAGNFKSLFEAIEMDQAARGNLTELDKWTVKHVVATWNSQWTPLVLSNHHSPFNKATVWWWLCKVCSLLFPR